MSDALQRELAKAGPLPFDKDGPRICFKLPWNGDVVVERMPENGVFGFPCDTRPIACRSLGVHGQLVVELVFDSLGLATKEHQPSRHFQHKVFGDAYIYACIRPCENLTWEHWGAYLRAAKKAFGDDCWWDDEDEYDMRGFPIPDEFFEAVVTGLRIVQLFDLSTLREEYDDCVHQMLGYAHKESQAFYSDVHRGFALIPHAFLHPSAEIYRARTTCGGFRDVVLLRSPGAYDALLNKTLELYNAIAARHGVDELENTLDESEHTRFRKLRIPHPKLGRVQYGQRVGREFAILQRAFLRSFELPVGDGDDGDGDGGDGDGDGDDGDGDGDDDEEAARARRRAAMEAAEAAEAAEARKREKRLKEEAKAIRDAKAAREAAALAAPLPPMRGNVPKATREAAALAEAAHAVHVAPATRQVARGRFDDKQAADHAAAKKRKAKKAYEQRRDAEKNKSAWAAFDAQAAPRKATTADFLLRVDKPTASALAPTGATVRDDDVQSVATSSIPVETTRHAEQRMEERSIHLRELQTALKHGDVRAGNSSDTKVHEHDGVRVVTDDAASRIITAARRD